MKIVSVKEFVAIHGVTQELARGRWKSWDKPGTYQLRGRQLCVRPLIWDEVSGTAFVAMPVGHPDPRMLVRVENLVKYKAVLTGGATSQRKTTTKRVKVNKNLPTTAEELLLALGL